MADANSCSGDEYSDEDEEGEELDPRVQDELEKLNVAANSVNHLEAELDEARAVFRQTMAAATYHLNAYMKKLGNKNIQKARPFYDVLREWRKAHFELQRTALQYEKANSRHVCARQRVHDAEHRVFSSGEKRAFDTALQEMLNQATIEVNEAENQKKQSWVAHQKTYKSYQDIEKKAKEMQNKLKKSVEKAKPYFVQKVSYDRHLWQLKRRVDSIQKGLGEAKEIYSKCLKSLETISDDIHQKRRDKKMIPMIANLQEREAGVGADSEDEVSLNQSQLDLDLDCNSSLSEVHGILPDDLPELPPFSSDGRANNLMSSTEGSFATISADGVAAGVGNMSLECESRNTLDRQVSGAESSDSLKREVYGCEQGENEAGECNSEDVKTKETEQTEEAKNLKTEDRLASVSTGTLENGNVLSVVQSFDIQREGSDDVSKEDKNKAGDCNGEDVKTQETEQIEEVKNLKTEEIPSVRTDTLENDSVSSVAQSSDVQGSGNVAKEGVNACEESVSPNQHEATGLQRRLEDIESDDSGAGTLHKVDEVDGKSQTLVSEMSSRTENIQNQHCTSSGSETLEATDDVVALETENKQISQLHVVNNNADQSSSQEVSQNTEDNTREKDEWI